MLCCAVGVGMWGRCACVGVRIAYPVARTHVIDGGCAALPTGSMDLGFDFIHRIPWRPCVTHRLVLALVVRVPSMLAAMGRFSAGNGGMAAAEQTKPPAIPTAPEVSKPQGRGLHDDPFERRKQHQHQHQPPRAAASDPLQAFLQKKRQREQQTFAVARRPRLTAAALRADPALTLPTHIPIAARLLVMPPGAAATDVDVDVELTLCEVDMAVYHRDPTSLPTAADLTRRFCADGTGAGAVVVRRASELAMDASDAHADADMGLGPQLLPAGFIFHQTPLQQHRGGGGHRRLGSVLASVPTNLVHSEPGLLLELLRECEERGLPEAARVEAVRATVLGMGRSRHHQDVFLELGPAMVPHMGVLLAAFPETPWAFVYHRCVCLSCRGVVWCGVSCCGMCGLGCRSIDHRNAIMADLQLPYHNRLDMYACREPVAAAVRAAADEAARATAELTATAIKHLQSVRARVHSGVDIPDLGGDG